VKYNIFREYDIRGIVGSEIVLENVEDLAISILTYFLQEKPDLSKIVVGMDGRTHSPIIKEKIIKAVTKLGIDVVDIGLCPSPTFYFSLFNTEISSGLMITASHNPKDYNGIKICLNKKSVWGNQIREIKKIYDSKKFYENKTGKIGSVSNYNMVDFYLNWLSSHFDHLKDKSIDAVIDCGNGTAGVIFPKLVKMMGWKNVKILFEEVDGNFPNHEADPTNPKNMQDVKKCLFNEPFKVGIGLDGDSDRMNPMTKSGYLVPGDKLLAIYSKKIVKEYEDVSVVFDIKSSEALAQELENIGAKPVISPSGHSIIKDNLLKNKAKLAGELSCHFFFNDRYFGFDDGIYAALRLFEILEESDQSLDEMLELLPKKVNSPEYRIKCTDENKSQIVDHVKNIFSQRDDAKLLTIDGIRAKMDYGWGLVRASNTQAAICLRFESDTDDGLKKVENDFVQAIKPFFDSKKLKENFGG